MQYCRENGPGVFDRLVRAHTNRRFVMPKPEDETLLRQAMTARFTAMRDCSLR